MINLSEFITTLAELDALEIPDQPSKIYSVDGVAVIIAVSPSWY
jgi:hypothetical protein